MSEWEPATDAEVAMRDALRTDDQESYFRILSGVDLLLPVSADALAGLAPLGWGTWSTGGRTHVLAFTSSAALQACLADYTGSARRVPYAELANTWPNLEWWLAVNPGLPIEGYLPAWFVAQLSRGDLRLPTRGPARETTNGTSKIQDLQAAALAAAARDDLSGPGGPAPDRAPQAPGARPAAVAQGQPSAPAGQFAASPSASQAQLTSPYGESAAVQATGAPASAYEPSGSGYGQSSSPYGQAGTAAQATSGQPGTSQPGLTPPPGYAQSSSGAPAGYSQSSGGAPAGYSQSSSGAPAGYSQSSGGAPAGYAQSSSGAPAGYPQSSSGAPAGYAQSSGGAPAGYAQAAAARPAGYPRSTSPSPTGREELAPALGNIEQPADNRQPSDVPGDYWQPDGMPPADQHPSGSPEGYQRPPNAPAAYRQSEGAVAASPEPGHAPAAYQQAAAPAGYQQPAAAPAGYQQAAAAPAGYQQAAAAPAGYELPPAGLASPGNATEARPVGYPQPISAPPARPVSRPPLGAADPAPIRSGGFDQSPHGSTGFGHTAASEARPAAAQVGPGGLPLRTPSGVLPNGLPTRAPIPSASAASPAAPAAAPSGAVSRPPSGPMAPDRAAAATGWPSRATETDPRAPLPGARAPLPVRTPMAQTPPVSENFAVHNPDEVPFEPSWSPERPAPAGPAELPRRQPAPSAGEIAGGHPSGPASPQGAAAQRGGLNQRPDARLIPGLRPTAEPSAAGPGFGGPLPRRQAAPASEQQVITSFPAFQTPAGQGVGRQSDLARPVPESPLPASALETTRPGVLPPVVPGSPGNDRPARFGGGSPLSGPRPATASPEAPIEATFVPANDVERNLFEAADAGNTDVFLSTLLLATVLLPVAPHSRPGSAPGEPGFVFRTEQLDGEQFLVVFTSADRLDEHFDEPTSTVEVRFLELISSWPDPAWSFAINPDGPVGAKYPGPQVIALANWATESGLGAEPTARPVDEDRAAPVPAPEPASDDAQHATVMQKTLPPEQVDYYLDRGYDRVAGFVHRASEVEHLRTPGELFGALGLSYDTSPHQPDAKEAFVLRWPAYRPSLYRIPYGGQNEQALRAMDGWVIERAPFRGNGFAPGEGRDVVAEFKVDSVRLPHGSQLWRIDADGDERMIAIFDNDGPLWRRVGEQ